MQAGLKWQDSARANTHMGDAPAELPGAVMTHTYMVPKK